MISWPNCTCTIWKRRPMMRARRNSFCTCSGVASVATSKSFGAMPSSRSRTAPPTINARWPACCRPSVTRMAFREISAGLMPCTSAGMITGMSVTGTSATGMSGSRTALPVSRAVLRRGLAAAASSWPALTGARAASSASDGAVSSAGAGSCPNSLRINFLITWVERVRGCASRLPARERVACRPGWSRSGQ